MHWKFWSKYGPVSHLFSCNYFFSVSEAIFVYALLWQILESSPDFKLFLFTSIIFTIFFIFSWKRKGMKKHFFRKDFTSLHLTYCTLTQPTRLGNLKICQCGVSLIGLEFCVILSFIVTYILLICQLVIYFWPKHKINTYY